MDESIFLQAIFKSGYSTESRLVYADWLEENGDWRAELVRVNCLLSEVDSANDDPESKELRDRELLLSSRIGDRKWLQAVIIPRLIPSPSASGEPESSVFGSGLPTSRTKKEYTRFRIFNPGGFLTRHGDWHSIEPIEWDSKKGSLEQILRHNGPNIHLEKNLQTLRNFVN